MLPHADGLCEADMEDLADGLTVPMILVAASILFLSVFLVLSELV